MTVLALATGGGTLALLAALVFASVLLYVAVRRLVRRSKSKGHRAVEESFEFCVAFASSVTALAFLLDRDPLSQTAAAVYLGTDYAVALQVLYLVGGALVVAGLLTRRYLVEISGLSFFSCAFACNAIILIAQYGGQSHATASTYVALCVAGVVRVVTLVGNDPEARQR